MSQNVETRQRGQSRRAPGQMKGDSLIIIAPVLEAQQQWIMRRLGLPAAVAKAIAENNFLSRPQ